MILATRFGNQQVESRDIFDNLHPVPLPWQVGGGWSHAGKRVDVHQATGLTAMMRAIRLLAETVGQLPMGVYRGDHDEMERAPETPQWELLHRRPNPIQSTFGFFSFATAAVVARGGMCLRKAKTPQGEVVALLPIHPDCVKVRWTGAALEFEVTNLKGGERKILSSAEVLYIPGVLLDNPFVGVSPVIKHANAIGTALATEEYAGRFYANDATPGGALKIPQGSNSAQAREMRDFWEANHRGAQKAHKTAVLFGGADYATLGVNAQEAQLIESQKWGVEEVSRAVGVSAHRLGGENPNPSRSREQDNQDFLQFELGPWLARMEQALHADDDLFPDKALFPRFQTEGLLRADIKTRFEAYLKGRQAGWLSANDIRRKEGEKPIPGGDTYQTTPVGGTPNLQPGNDDPSEAA